LGSGLKNTEVAQIFELLFCPGTYIPVLILTKKWVGPHFR
jgi:hypothetical protein